MASEAAKRFPVDALHAGIRFAVVAAFFGAAALAVLLIMPTITGTLRLGGIIGLLVFVAGASGISIGFSLLVDRVLRQIWPSGRWIDLDDGSVTYQEKDGSRTAITLTKDLRVTVWHFVIRQSRTWVPQGWHCVACQLAQGDSILSLYAFMKPDQASRLPRWGGFQQVVPRKDLVGKDAELPEVQIKLRLAERTRWETGLELFADDFQVLLEALDQRVEVWSSADQGK